MPDQQVRKGVHAGGARSHVGVISPTAYDLCDPEKGGLSGEDYTTAALMASQHIRRLPLIRDEKLAGIITARDLVEAYAK